MEQKIILVIADEKLNLANHELEFEWIVGFAPYFFHLLKAFSQVAASLALKCTSKRTIKMVNAFHFF